MVWFLKLSCRTPQLAALIIGKCGFGFSFDWFEPARSANGKMTIQHALHVVSESTMVLLFVPKWLQRLPFLGYVNDGISSIFPVINFSFPFHRMREAVEADGHLMEFMKTQVKERRAEIGSIAPSDRKIENDLFTMLVQANEDEGGKLKLDDEELVSPPSLFRNFCFYSECDADR